MRPRIAWTSLLTLALACGQSSTDEASSETGCTPGSESCVCTAEGACDPGLACVADECVALDDTSTTGDGDGGDGDGDGGDGDGEGDTSCHPLMITCPIVGTTCTWDGQEFLCAPGMIALGDSCDPANPVCISGFCAPMGMLPNCPSTHCCTAFCNLDSPFCPDASTQCVDYFPPGATTPEVGACLAP
jgi:hypothetical protein